jgi:hypothetical protein
MAWIDFIRKVTSEAKSRQMADDDANFTDAVAWINLKIEKAANEGVDHYYVGEHNFRDEIKLSPVSVRERLAAHYREQGFRVSTSIGLTIFW